MRRAQGLTRVTIAAPRRRIDVALPEHVATAEILPGLLRHAGDDLADAGEKHGGWVLRRHDGSALDPARTLGAQELRDGEVLHLLPRRDDWPEMDYDDVVDAIATGARRNGTAWTRASTRRCGLAVAAGVLVLALGLLFLAGPPWTVPGISAVAVAVVLVGAATLLARVLPDSLAGAVLGAAALPYAFVGALVAVLGPATLGEVGAAELLLASSTLVLAGVGVLIGVGDRLQWPVAAIVTGLGGVLGASLSYAGTTPGGAAAVVVSLAVALVPAVPLLAMRLGKLPMPALPTTVEDLLRDEKMPSRATVYGLVVRSDELLTGMLLGASVVSSVCLVFLVLEGGNSQLALVAIVSAASLLRARLFPTVRQRVPLLALGLAGLSTLALGSALYDPVLSVPVLVPVMLVVAAVVVTAGLVYSRRNPTPYFGRVADILDVLLVIAVVPVTCGTLGLYDWVRGLGG